MPMFKALKLCPHATVVKPNMAKYVEVGRDIRARMQALTPAVQPLSIDEAFLDLTGTRAPARRAARRWCWRASRATSSARSASASRSGLSDCKFLAKLASDLDKPRGFAIIGRAEAISFLAPLPIGRIWGVGAVALRSGSSAMACALIADVQALSETDMMRRHGDEGRRLWRLSHAIDDRVGRVRARHEKHFRRDDVQRGSRHGRTTFCRFCTVFANASRTAQEGFGLAGRSITLKLKTADFRIRTRSRSGLRPTQLAGRLFRSAGRC